jgi:glycerol-3-phosphate acyltransferase PlsX
MKIAVDAMGGDFAPQEIVAGAVEAARDFGISVILTGPIDVLQRELQKHQYPEELIEIVAADETIEMGEHPARAVRKKKNASVVVANQLVKDGKANAVVSAGNTGAAMTASLFILERIPGISRPAIAIPVPTVKGVSVLLDAGANADCDPEDLVQFAVMGSIYAEKVLGASMPRVALLSIGEEETKGNKLTIEAHQLLKKAPINFMGNIEGKDLLTGEADVIVCDGFVGNTVLKLVEGLAGTLFAQIKDVFCQNPLTKLAALAVLPGIKGIGKRFDYSEYGGTILLGVNGISLISHGRSNAKAMRNAIRAAHQAAMEGVIGIISHQLTGPVSDRSV